MIAAERSDAEAAKTRSNEKWAGGWRKASALQTLGLTS